MKKRAVALALSGCLLLTSCEAMLERSYSVSAAHVDKPTTAEDSSALRVENYRELVSAVLYLVSQGQEEGVIQLYDYDGEVENDLPAACLEVAQEDPLGAYAVDYIKHEYTRVVSYYQATISVRYRRSMEQVRSIVNVTGTRAIRTELGEALAEFAPEVVLRVAYFAEDADSIARLIRQAYYDAPASALGLPTAEIALYPDEGSQRVVEILLTYPESPEELRRKREEAAESLAAYHFEDTHDLDQAGIARYVQSWLSRTLDYDPEAGGTVYDALVEERANSEGMALAYALVCGQIDGAPACNVVEGTLEGESWFWNSLHFSDGTVGYVDPARVEAMGWTFHTAGEMLEMGYLWPEAPVEGVQETQAGEAPEPESPEQE